MRRLSLGIYVLLSFEFAVSLGTGLLQPMFPTFLKTFVKSAFLVGLIVAAGNLTGAIFSTPIGYLSDRLGKRNMLLLLCLFIIVGTSVYITTSDSYLFVLAQLFVGVGLLSGLVVRALSLNMVKTDDRGLAVGSIMATTNLGSNIIGPFLGGLLVVIFTAVTAFYARLGFTMLAMLIAVFLVKDRQINGKSSVIGASNIKTDLRNRLSSFRTSIANRPIASCSIVFFATGISIAIIFTYLVLFMQKLNLSSQDIGVAFSVTGIAIPIMQVLGGQACDMVRKKRIIMILGTGVSSVAMFCMFLSGNYAALFLSLLLFRLSSPLKDPVAVTIAGNASKSHSGTGVGVIFSFYYLGLILGNIVGGFLYDQISSTAPFAFAFVLGILATTAASVLMRNADI